MKKVNINKREEVIRLIGEVESSAKSRLMCSFEDILKRIEQAENEMQSLGIAKKYRTGSMLYFFPESVANSYKHKAEGTHLKLEYFPTGWFVVSCFRGSVRKQPFGGFAYVELWLSKEAKEAISSTIKLT